MTVTHEQAGRWPTQMDFGGRRRIVNENPHPSFWSLLCVETEATGDCRLDNPCPSWQGKLVPYCRKGKEAKAWGFSSDCSLLPSASQTLTNPSDRGRASRDKAGYWRGQVAFAAGADHSRRCSWAEGARGGCPRGEVSKANWAVNKWYKRREDAGGGVLFILLRWRSTTRSAS